MYEVHRFFSTDVNRLMAGNKNDLTAKRAVSYEEAKGFAKLWDIQFVETSAKHSPNFDEVLRIASARLKLGWNHLTPWLHGKNLSLMTHDRVRRILALLVMRNIMVTIRARY